MRDFICYFSDTDLSIYFYFTAFTHFSDNHLLIIIATIFCYFSAVGIMKDVKDCYNLYKNKANILFLANIIKINEDNIEVNFCKNLSANKVNSFLKIINNEGFNQDRRQQNIDCDLLIYDPDIIPNTDLYYQLISTNFPNEVYVIGNALSNSSLAEIIRGAYFVGKNL